MFTLHIQQTDTAAIAKSLQYYFPKSPNVWVSLLIFTLGGLMRHFLPIISKLYSDYTDPTDILLTKLGKGILSKTGKKRLSKELQELSFKIASDQSRIPSNYYDCVAETNYQYNIYIKRIATNLWNIKPEFNDSGDTLIYIPVNCELLGESFTESTVKKVTLSVEAIASRLNNIEKALLLNSATINNANKIHLWFSINDIAPKDYSELNKSYNEVTEIVAKYIGGGTQVYFEAFMSNDSIEGIDSTKATANEEVNANKIPSNNKSIPTSGKLIEYIRYRNKFYSALQKGAVISKVDHNPYPIPLETLENRIISLQKHYFDSQSSIINIYGQPGSGKTELINSLINKNKIDGTVFICINDSILAEALTQSVDGDISYFANTLSHKLATTSSIYMPNELKSDYDSNGARDTLYAYILAKHSNISIVFDNYHIYNKVADDKIILLSKLNWIKKILLISRPKLTNIIDNSLVRCFQCETWSREESKAIIANWDNKLDINLIDKAINKGWFKTESVFSTYMLRLIHASAFTGMLTDKDSPDILLKREIKRILSLGYSSLNPNSGFIHPSKVLDNIYTLITSYKPDNYNLEASLIGQIRGSIENARATKDIDEFVYDLGEASWAYKFSKSDNILTDTTLKSTVKSTINYFDIDPMLKAGIFREVNVAEIDWADPLVSEGCLALKLAKDIYSCPPEKYAEISGRLQGLGDNNSLNILRLIIKDDLIKKLATIVSLTNYNKIDVLYSIIKENGANSYNKELVNNLLSIIIEPLSSKVIHNNNITDNELESYLTLAKTIDILVKHQKDFEDLTMILLSYKNTAQLIGFLYQMTVILENTNPNTEEIIDLINNYYEYGLITDNALLALAYLLPKNIIHDSIFCEIIKSLAEKYRNNYLYFLFQNRMHFYHKDAKSNVLNFASTVLNFLIFNNKALFIEISRTILNMLSDKILHYGITNELKLSWIRRDLLSKIQALLDANTIQEDALLKEFIRFKLTIQGRRFIDCELIIINRDYLVPVVPFCDMTIAEIAASISENKYYGLAKVADLSVIVNNTSITYLNNEELVSDGFPNGTILSCNASSQFKYTTLNEIRNGYNNGVKLSFVDNAERGSKKLQWHPKIKIIED